jgi:hypothetical protein
MFVVAVKVPFNSSTGRQSQAQAPAKENQLPGPGAYIDVNNPIHSSVTKGILKFATDRGIMEAQGLACEPFGSTETRFKAGYFRTKDGPGPGDYAGDEAKKDDLERVYEKIAKPRSSSQSSMFSSKTNRFQGGSIAHPLILVVEGSQRASRGRPNRAIYEQCPGEPWVKQTRSAYYAWCNAAKLGFNSTAPRWHSTRQLSVKSPGPGSYSFAGHRDAQGIRSQQGSRHTPGVLHNRADSYRPKTGTSNKLGPGAYATDMSMIKRSFNMSLDNSFAYL